MTNSHFAARVGLTALTALTLSVAGCGGAAKPKPESGGASSTAGADSTGVAFARCMRAHGVQIADPAPGSGATLTSSARDDTSVTTLDRANRACNKLLPEQAQASGATDDDSSLKLARCLRSHGVNVADPVGGQAVQFGDNVDPSDPGVQSAQTACGMAAGSAPATIGKP